MSKIIVIESVEALAEQVIKAIGLWEVTETDTRTKDEVVLSCLHPIEVPSDAVELVEKIIMLFAEAQIKQTDEAITQALAEAAALITAYSRTVPRCYEEKNRCNDCPADYPDKECPSYPEAQGNCEGEESEEAGA